MKFALPWKSESNVSQHSRLKSPYLNLVDFTYILHCCSRMKPTRPYFLPQAGAFVKPLVLFRETNQTADIYFHVNYISGPHMKRYKRIPCRFGTWSSPFLNQGNSCLLPLVSSRLQGTLLKMNRSGPETTPSSSSSTPQSSSSSSSNINKNLVRGRILSRMQMHSFTSLYSDPSPWMNAVGCYAIYDASRTLRYIGYTKNLGVKLACHAAKQREACRWFKACVAVVRNPSQNQQEQREVEVDPEEFENLLDLWVLQNGKVPLGNTTESEFWKVELDGKVLQEQMKNFRERKIHGGTFEYDENPYSPSNRRGRAADGASDMDPWNSVDPYNPFTESDRKSEYKKRSGRSNSSPTWFEKVFSSRLTDQESPLPAYGMIVLILIVWLLSIQSPGVVSTETLGM